MLIYSNIVLYVFIFFTSDAFIHPVIHGNVKHAAPISVNIDKESDLHRGRNWIKGVLNIALVSFLWNCDISFAEGPPNELIRVKKGLREIDYLLKNWEEKTTYCNFGEFQRELLDSKKKEQLMEAAAKGGLLDFDKSDTMNVMCRRDPQVVRAFLGLTDDNPNLSHADILFKKKSTLELVDPDRIDEYIDAVDKFGRSISNVDSLSYNARSDFSSSNTFVKGQENILKNGITNNFLEQSRKSVMEVRDALTTIVDVLGV